MKNIKRSLLAMTLITHTSLLHAFTWNKCQKVLSDRPKYHINLLNYSSNVTTSFGQFSTSTGGCAMIGKAEHDRKVFLVYNLENLKSDSAKGGGEYLTAYATYLGCGLDGAKEVSKVFQDSYQLIFGNKLENSAESVFNYSESLLRNNPNVIKECKTALSIS